MSREPSAPPEAHPRDAVCEAAGEELKKLLEDWLQRHRLTQVEYLYMLSAMTVRACRTLGLTERGLSAAATKV